MKKRLIFAGIVFFLLLVVIFAKIEYKKKGLGNNINNSINILNISSYEAILDITVYSNKNTNRYVISQKCDIKNKIEQEVLEPNHLKGLTMIADGQNVTIENKQLNLKTLYENGRGDLSNISLISFVKNFEQEGEIQEQEEEIIMKTKIANSVNPYQMYQNLYISKTSNLPTKMELCDRNKNTTVYILYNEIKLNQTSKNDSI